MTRPRYIPPHLRTGGEGQRACVRFWESVGGIVYTTSDTRAVAATPGISDLLVFLPNRALFVGWESKEGFQGGGTIGPTDPRRLSDEQRAFLALMQRGYATAGGFGDAMAAQRFLLALPRRTA